jgi:hypothetical protein
MLVKGPLTLDVRFHRSLEGGSDEKGIHDSLLVVIATQEGACSSALKWKSVDPP